MTREDFRSRWNTRLDECARLGSFLDGERVCRQVLADFDAVVEAEDQRLLPLADAAGISGYSPDHLRRLHREGAIQGERRGRRLFFRAVDLPKKVRLGGVGLMGRYDPVADARRLLARLQQPPSRP